MFDRIKAKIRGTIDLKQLKKDGLTVGENFHAQEGVIIDPGHCWLISIGNNVTLAPRVHILAHDASTKIPLGYTKIGTVSIGNNVFIGAGTIILPSVSISDNVIVGAGSVVANSLASGIYVGSPCVKIAEYDAWVMKQKEKMEKLPIFDSSYIIGSINDDKKKTMKELVEPCGGFVL